MMTSLSSSSSSLSFGLCFFSLWTANPFEQDWHDVSWSQWKCSRAQGQKKNPPARRPMWRSDHGGMTNPFLVLHKNPSGSRWDGLRSWKLPRTNFDDQARRCGRIPSKPTVSGPNTPGSVFPSPRLPVVSVSVTEASRKKHHASR